MTVVGGKSSEIQIVNDWELDVSLPICSFIFFFFKQKTAYEIKECDWSSDVCSSDLAFSGLLPCAGIRSVVKVLSMATMVLLSSVRGLTVKASAA